MAKNNTWGLNDSLWGGETFKSKETRSRLDIRRGIGFASRLERRAHHTDPSPQQ